MEVYHICRIAVAPLRKEPSDRSEIVSQLLFGDRVKVLEKTEKWCFVSNLFDGYEGWMDYKQLEKISEQQFQDHQSYIYLAPAQFSNIVIGPNQTPYYLSPGSILPYYNNGICILGEKKFEVNFMPVIPNASDFDAEVESVAKFFENSPYLWGGRTLFGIDCSGFAQTVYKLTGIDIRRDASQQAEQGELVDFLASARTGDLAFFDNEEGKIIHVGIMLGNDKIIHAAGFVKIDPIDDQGIFNQELNNYTHKLRIIKRFS